MLPTRSIYAAENELSTSSSSAGHETDEETTTAERIPPPLPPPRTKSDKPKLPVPLLPEISIGSSDSELETSAGKPSTEVAVPPGCDSHVMCEGCKHWEDKIKALQLEHTSTSNRLSATVAELHSVKKFSEETDIRAKAERILFEEKTASFEKGIEQLGKRLEELLKNYQEYRRSSEVELNRLEQEREGAQMDIMEVEEHYQTLLGKRRDAAAEMAAPIDLPSAKDELEHHALLMREDLLSTNVAREHLLHRLDVETLKHRNQLIDERRERMQAEQIMHQRIQEAHARLAEALQANEAAGERAAAENHLNEVKVHSLTESIQRVTDENTQLRKKIASLQSDLENSEKVSKDFVRLSQHLQIQLEKQREQTYEVRWQDPEDVDACSSCVSVFTSAAAKANCRHCGRIFCPECLSKRIAPGANRSKAAPVCDMCHTLLVKDAAPYFSKTDFSEPTLDDLYPTPPPPPPPSQPRRPSKLPGLMGAPWRQE